MVFVQNVKKNKVSAKLVKSVGANVNSIGFPASEVEKGHLSFENISEKIGAKSFEIKDKHIVFLIGNADAKRDYNKWTETIQEDKNVVAAKDPAPIYKTKLDMNGIINMIKNYDLANSTPTQGLNFIQQLKSELYQIEKNNGNISSFKMMLCFEMCKRYVLLPVTGNRNNSNSSLNNVGSNGNYWSSTVDDTISRGLGFNISSAGMDSNGKAVGYSMRCIKE